jgi:hypothetical protein
MEKKKIFRIIDANFNRLREGLRVLEESERLGKDNKGTSGRLKTLRHSVAECYSLFPGKKLLSARESDTDVGREGASGSEMRRVRLADILNANFKRCEEAARVLEEYSKLICPKAVVKIKGLRFELYSMEKNWR